MPELGTGQNSITVKFWGVRGSYPAPGAETVHYGGNTPCIEVSTAGHTIILDAGTGIIPLGRDLLRRSIRSRQPVEATLLFSHMHHDHTQGFPFFVPAFVMSTRLHIFGPHLVENGLEQVLAHNMIPPFFPVTLHDMSATKDISSLSESQCILLCKDNPVPVLQSIGSHSACIESDAVCIRVLKSYAHPGGVLIYRIEWRGWSVVYATDTEGYANTDRRLASFAHGTDLLIHDAQYTEEHYLGLAPDGRSTQGWGHSTAAMACDVAQAAVVKRLALFHFDPGYSDRTVAHIEKEACQRFSATLAAREGLEITLDADAPMFQPRPKSRPARTSVASIQ